jgi:hypothetical protein
MKAIPKFSLKPIPMDDNARQLQPFQWASPEVGNRHQLGGTPSFLQKANIPTCPICRKEMTFYAQLDSINDEFIIADCGMIYVFVCFDCNSVVSFIQSS